MTLSGHAVVDRLSRALPALAADLLEIAASIHAIDWLVPRPTERQRPAGAMWARSLWADIPVREPDRWRQQIPLLSQLLHWLTATGLTGLVPEDVYERQGHDREFNLNAMIWQVTRMRACLDSPEPWRRMVSEFPDLIDVTSLTQQEVVRLYRAYVEEWGSHEDAVRSHGLARRERRTVALCLMTSEARLDSQRRWRCGCGRRGKRVALRRPRRLRNWV
jgi:hypothetical protein